MHKDWLDRWAQAANEGRSLVKAIWFNGANGDLRIESSEATRLEYVELDMGDRSECYVLEFQGTVLTKSHNARYITTIEWCYK